MTEIDAVYHQPGQLDAARRDPQPSRPGRPGLTAIQMSSSSLPAPVQGGTMQKSDEPQTLYHHHPVAARRRRAASIAVPMIGLLAVLVAACGSGKAPPASRPASAKSLPASTSSPAATPAATMTLTWPKMIGSEVMISVATGEPASAPESDAGFMADFPAAKDAHNAAYLPKAQLSSTSTNDLISVIAGQLKPGVNPTSTFQSYYTAANQSVERTGHVAEGFVDEVTVPPGPLGGLIRCWDQIAYGNSPSTAYCMWMDTSTYGVLAGTPRGGTDPTSALAKMAPVIRAGMER
jgi:hypothetical protein